MGDVETGPRASRVDRAEIRFAAGTADGPHSQTWLVRSWIERSTGSALLFVGPSRALRRITRCAADRAVDVVIPDDNLHVAWARLTEPRFDIGPGGIEVVPGWEVAAVVVVAPAAVNHTPGTVRSRPLTYYPPPRPGRVFQVVVARGRPGAEPLSIATGNDAGTLRLPGAPPIRVWINHVPHQPGIDGLVLAARRELASRPEEEQHGFLHAITDQHLPILVDLGVGLEEHGP